MFHWEIIWSFLQGSLGLTQKQHCIRCRFYKVYLINYKTINNLFFFFFLIFFLGGGVVVFVFVVVFLVFFVKTWNACNLNYSHQISIHLSVCIQMQNIHENIWFSLGHGQYIFYSEFFSRHIKDKQIMIILYLPAPI